MSAKFISEQVGSDSVAVQVVETHYTVAEAAAKLKLSPDYIGTRIKRGEIRATEFGTSRSKYRISASALQEFIDSLPQTA